MPCYSAWNEFLEPGTAAYEVAEAEVLAKLRAMQHAVSYYFEVAGEAVPLAHKPPNGPEDQASGDLAALVPVTGEEAIVDRITHHLACDGVQFTTLYDAVSLLRLGDSTEAGFARVLLLCASQMRAAKHGDSPPPARGSLFTLTSGVWYAAEFIGDEFADQDRHYSPIRIEDFKLLKTGRGDLKLAFHHQNYPEGVQDKIYDLRVLERAGTYLLARSLTHEPARVLLITQLTWKWLREKLHIYPRGGQQDVQKRFA